MTGKIVTDTEGRMTNRNDVKLNKNRTVPGTRNTSPNLSPQRAAVLRELIGKGWVPVIHLAFSRMITFTLCQVGMIDSRAVPNGRDWMIEYRITEFGIETLEQWTERRQNRPGLVKENDDE